jgi:hypothetical protein
MAPEGQPARHVLVQKAGSRCARCDRASAAARESG